MTQKILYIDDEQINLDLLRFHFENIFEVYTCKSGKEGLCFLDEHQDITDVISDMKMEGMNGLKFIKEAQKKHRGKNYYMLSGFEMTEDTYKAMHEGIILDYFKKPCHFKTIIKTLIENHDPVDPNEHKTQSIN